MASRRNSGTSMAAKMKIRVEAQKPSSAHTFSSPSQPSAEIRTRPVEPTTSATVTTATTPETCR